MNYTSFSYTHPGHVREVNEDSYYSCNTDGLWMVCDGMGGHDDGSFSSHLVTDTFDFLTLGDDFDDNINMMIEQIKNIQKKLVQRVVMNNNNRIIGTTLILLYIKGKKAVTIHCGDSRCYILRENKLSLVTKDHVKDFQTEHGTRKVLTNALFAPGDVSIDKKEFLIKENDVFLLCSDGLYDNLSAGLIKNAMIQDNLSDSLDSLTQTVLNTEADDNLTAVMVKVS